MKTKKLSKKEIKLLNQEILDLYNSPDLFDRKENIISKEISKNEILYLKDDIVFLLRLNNILFPSLKLLHNKTILPIIEVDMKAIPFVTNGADIMRPGIVHISENIQENSIVAVCDETHKKAIAVGISTLNSEALKNCDKGKVIKNIHYIGDDYWKNIQ